ncbi:hypothetical protein ACIQXF_12510 [Lysinibacillus sp. NPDC097231]
MKNWLLREFSLKKTDFEQVSLEEFIKFITENKSTKKTSWLEKCVRIFTD